MSRRAEAALQALGDPTRRRILELLSEGPKSVREISDELPVTRPAVSHHLRVLRKADLVDADVDGTRRMYRIEPEGLAPVQAFLNDVWANALTRLKIVVENAPRRVDEDEEGSDAGES